MTVYEGTYRGSRPSQAAIVMAQHVLQQFLGSSESRSVVPRPTHNRMVVIDFTQGSISARGAFIDRPTQSFLVAHGSGNRDPVALPSTDVLPPGLSNVSGSFLSSAGLFIAKGIVPSMFGTRLRMFGVCQGLNDASDRRLIGMHPYGDEFFSRDASGRLAGIGTSLGCPAVSSGVAREVMPALDGGFIYIYHPQHPPRGFTSRPLQSTDHARQA